MGLNDFLKAQVLTLGVLSFEVLFCNVYFRVVFLINGKKNFIST